MLGLVPWRSRTPPRPTVPLPRFSGHGTRFARKARGPLPADGITVELRGGVYELSRPLELTAQDSGSQETPIVYRARKGEIVRLVGGRVVTGWKQVDDPAVLERLNTSARGQVWQET